MRREGKQAGGGQATAGSGVLYWLRQDLRLHDNPALCAAAQEAQRRRGKLTLVYINSIEEDGDDLQTGAAVGLIQRFSMGQCSYGSQG